MKNVLVSLLFFAGIAWGEDAPLLQAARQALAEGIPQVGIEKLRLYLESDLSEAERQRAKLEMAQGYIALRRTVEARKLLTELPVTDESRFFLIQSFLTDKNWAEVSRRLEMLPDPASPFFARTIFARAEARRGLGQNSLADADYRTIENDLQLGKSAKERRADLILQTGKPFSTGISLPLPAGDGGTSQQMAVLLNAQNELLEKKYSVAESHFRSLMGKSSQLTSRAFAAVRVGLARCLAARNRLEEAESVLEKFIEEQPAHESLSDVFAELNGIYQRESNPSQTQLRRWSRNPANPQRQALAIFYQSQFDLRDKGSDVALETLSNWLDKFPNHPLRANVLLQYGGQLAAEKKWPEAILRYQEALTPTTEADTKVRLHAALASALFSTGNYVNAAEQFDLAAQSLTSSSQNLLYNATLCWLRAMQSDRFLAGYQTFSTLFPTSPLRCDLLIEGGLLQARFKQIDQAIDTLNLAILSFPNHHRIADAYLALAEISIGTENPDPAYAESQLALAAKSPASSETGERIAYLHLFQQTPEEAVDTRKQIDHCETFIKEHPNSKLEAEVRFKMGEAWFAEKNYAAAGTQFEIISSQFPDSPLVEQSRFLAGQSAVRTMNPEAIKRAISLFQQVVDMKSPLQAYARFEQAAIKKNSGALEEALVLYDDLLNQKPPEDLRIAALAAKGETLYLLGGKDPKKLTDSIDTFTALIALPKVSRNWRNLALYKIGKAWGLLGKKESMLTSFYDVLAAPTVADETPEIYWFYRAGFEAAETLEGDQQWNAAIVIYKKLAEANGPRSAEARDRIERLRLEYFIWEK